MQQETVIVLDFGGQYNQLIARRVRECNVYCEIYSYRTDLAKIKAKNPKGIIFTGGPNSAYLPDSPTIDPDIYNWGVPILGICYGSQLMMHMLGGKVCKAPEREYGKTLVDLDTASPLFDTLPAQNVCWMSHNDYIEKAAPGFEIVAHTPNCPVAAAQDKPRGLYCSIGRCTDCVMVVDGVPNVRTCMTALKEGMKVQTQYGVSTKKEEDE